MAGHETSYLGRYLLSRGLISETDLNRALEHQAEANRRIGSHAQRIGLLDANQVEAVITEQRFVDKPFGSIALDMGFLTPRQLDNLLFSQTVNSTHLGEAMLELGILTPSQFDGLLREYNAMRDKRVMDLESVLATMQNHAMFKAVLTALERAFQRFVDQTVRFLSVDVDVPGDSVFARITVRATLGTNGWVEAVHYMSEEFAVSLAAGFTGKAPELCRSECLVRLEEFFAIMERYLASILVEQGNDVCECTLKVERMSGEQDLGDSKAIMRAVTNQGAFHLQVEVAKPRARAKSGAKHRG